MIFDFAATICGLERNALALLATFPGELVRLAWLASHLLMGWRR